MDKLINHISVSQLTLAEPILSLLEKKIANPFSNNAAASGDEKVRVRARRRAPRRPGSGKGKRERKEELWERRENCKTTYRATAHAERIIPWCGSKPRAIWPHANV